MKRYYLLMSMFALALSASPVFSDNQLTRTTKWYHPKLDVTWQWQLDGTLNTDYDAELYNVDLFDTPATTIAALQKKKRKVICYFSAGSIEAWRDDAALLPERVVGKKMTGWQDERWLDIRDKAVQTWIDNRMALAVKKGCNGVEPDNVDGYQNETGFPITADDQLEFNRFIATRAHEKGLAVGLKNNLRLIPKLVSYFDFAVNEQCFEYTECDALLPFIHAGKPVLNVEYQANYVNNAKARLALCKRATKYRFRTLILPLELDDKFRFSCFKD